MVSTNRLSILTVALLAFGSSQALATSLPESESNHPLTNAQVLSSSASQVQISGAISRDHDANDVDFFSFQANAGDILTLDIDYGDSSDATGLDTIIAIFNSNGQGLRANDDASVDPGSSSRRDSRIDNFVVPATGTYIVGVSSYPRYFMHGGYVRSGSLDEGTYQLIIDGLPVSMMHISMEIKPGNDDVSPPINPRSKGKIPVALLGSESFDVNDVDVGSLRVRAEPSQVRQESQGCQSGRSSGSGLSLLYPEVRAQWQSYRGSSERHDERKIESALPGRRLLEGSARQEGSRLSGRDRLRVATRWKAPQSRGFSFSAPSRAGELRSARLLCVRRRRHCGRFREELGAVTDFAL